MTNLDKGRLEYLRIRVEAAQAAADLSVAIVSLKKSFPGINLDRYLVDAARDMANIAHGLNS